MQSIRFLTPRLSFVRHPEDARFELGTHLLNSDSIRSRNAEARKEGFGLSWSWEQERFEFLAEKALWRPEGRELLIADLHLGKAEVFQAHGIPLPSDGDRGTLNPLLDLCARVQPKTLIILGDLVHGPLGLTASLRETLAALPELTGCPITLVGGNHDLPCRMLGLVQQPSYRLGQLWLSHEPEHSPDQSGQNARLLNICGHIHPVANLSSGSDRLRLPCFAYNSSEERLLIPAFGELTGGHECGQLYRKWLVAEGTIVPWQNPESRARKKRLVR